MSEQPSFKHDVPSFDVRLKPVQHADGSSTPSTLLRSTAVMHFDIELFRLFVPERGVIGSELACFLRCRHCAHDGQPEGGASSGWQQRVCAHHLARHGADR